MILMTQTDHLSKYKHKMNYPDELHKQQATVSAYDPSASSHLHIDELSDKLYIFSMTKFILADYLSLV